MHATIFYFLILIENHLAIIRNIHSFHLITPFEQKNLGVFLVFLKIILGIQQILRTFCLLFPLRHYFFSDSKI